MRSNRASKDMMANRKQVPRSVQAQVLTLSRRRCCVCFGLNRDEGIKKGQIAHLDQDSGNDELDNLAFLCLDHHAEYDSTSRQAKGLTIEEVKHFREELYTKYAIWGMGKRQYQLLNFLAYNIDVDALADAAINVGGSVVFYGAEHAVDVLTAEEITYSDWDMLGPHLVALDRFASWGLLEYEYDEYEQDGILYGHAIVKHEPICQQIVKVIRDRLDSQQPSAS